MAKEKIDPNETGVIRVKGDVYNEIVDVAESEVRTIGGQVEYMVKTYCTHPVALRQPRNVLVLPVAQATSHTVARVGKGQPCRGFFCAKCKAVVVPDEEMSEFAEAKIAGEVS